MSGVAWTLAVVQMDCATGDTERNLATIARFAREAASQQADLVVFPECATTGYFLGGRLADLAEPPDGPTAQRLGEIARRGGRRYHSYCACHGRQSNQGTRHRGESRSCVINPRSRTFEAAFL